MSDLTVRGGIDARIDAETEVKRSRFLCRIVRVEDEETARDAVERAYSDAVLTGSIRSTCVVVNSTLTWRPASIQI